MGKIPAKIPLKVNNRLDKKGDISKIIRKESTQKINVVTDQEKSQQDTIKTLQLSVDNTKQTLFSSPRTKIDPEWNAISLIDQNSAFE